MDEGSVHYGSALSLNSLSSLGSATTPQPSPPMSKRWAAPQVSDPGMTGSGPSPADPGEGQVAGGSSKGETGFCCGPLHDVTEGDCSKLTNTGLLSWLSAFLGTGNTNIKLHAVSCADVCILCPTLPHLLSEVFSH